jgi:hypothetical protein
MELLDHDARHLATGEAAGQAIRLGEEIALEALGWNSPASTSCASASLLPISTAVRPSGSTTS